MAFEGELVVTNTFFVLEKFLINIFPLKDFLYSLLKLTTARCDTKFAQQLIDKASCWV
jgi:hypothetical protein